MQYQISASAVTMFTPWGGATPLAALKRHAWLGSDQDFTVYFGELNGLWIATALC